MRTSCLVAYLAALSLVAGACATRARLGAPELRDEAWLAADAYLRQHFTGTGEFPRITYVCELSTPVLIDQPVLRRLLPDTTFYRAVLWTGQSEYMELQTLIATTNTSAGFVTVHCPSPTWSETPREFLAVFHGLAASTLAERRDLVTSIAQLLAQITYKGRVEAVSATPDMVSAELWHGHLHWRDVCITFSADNTVAHVWVTNPKAT